MTSILNYEIEEQVLKTVQDCISSFRTKLQNSNVEINDIKIERSGNGDTYFSEIEIEFWKGHKLVDALSVIIFMQGRITVEEHEVYDWLHAEISLILQNE